MRITEGAFAGLDAIYQMNDAEGRAMVLLDLLSKPVAMTIDAASLRKEGDPRLHTCPHTSRQRHFMSTICAT